jgi:hypothetical protein
MPGRRCLPLLTNFCHLRSPWLLSWTRPLSLCPAAAADSLGAARGTNRHLVKQQRKALENYCHDVLERWVGGCGGRKEEEQDGERTQKGEASLRLRLRYAACPLLPATMPSLPPITCRHEDTLSQALRDGRVTEDSASDFLCFATARHCNAPLATHLPGEAEAAAAEAAEAAAGQQQRDAAAKTEL